MKKKNYAMGSFVERSIAIYCCSINKFKDLSIGYLTDRFWELRLERRDRSVRIRPSERADPEDGGDCGDGEEDGEDEMVGRMLLKNSYKLSDEGAVARWPDGG